MLCHQYNIANPTKKKETVYIDKNVILKYSRDPL